MPAGLDPLSISDRDAHWMRSALRLAERGRGRVEPNPMVGCVLVRNDVEVASGFHASFGGPHAEVEALKDCDPELVSQSTLFVTLEPCSHHGKTPPCIDLLLRKKPQRVVIAMKDPFPEVAGRGIDALKLAGIPVQVGVLEQEAQWLNAPYLKRLRSGLPWVIAKWAMTLDGAIATSSGDSQWITGESTRAAAHDLRSRMDAILVGSETVLKDDPRLTARPSERQGGPNRVCTRVVLDRRFRIREDCQLVSTASESPVLVVAADDHLQQQSMKRRALEALGVTFLPISASELPMAPQATLRWLANQGATNVLVEGGGTLLGSFFDEKLVDQVECFIAPRILASKFGRRPVEGAERFWMNQTQDLKRTTVRVIGADINVSGYLTDS